MWLSLILSFLLVIITYITGRFSPNSSLNHNLPKKYLIKSEKIKKYFFLPSWELTKHFVGLHFSMIYGLIFNIILYVCYFYNGSTSFILESEFFIKIYGIIVLSIIMFTYILNTFLHAKYSFRNK